ncbi:LysR family transcriptional regulator [Streptomyces yaizuensis]|uniref:LysR family transcriptional regulator n=1 Tax=Streptomyces yaizuensis TaxID=2989713 RepID=A0ABQ5NSF2_9ACTN|nr:LysR family transcriptional regulator [Streptomyces sp. YSPA8]GLF93297.1 LysR family transcriptional regulator [Streptomyces sp. YSPA8]
MELRTLEYFVAVAEEGSFTRAASRCHVVRSAISHRIRDLEKQLGEALFERLPRQVVLTSGGAALLPHARTCLAAVTAAAAAFDDHPRDVSGALSLGTVGGLAGTVLPGLLGAYHRRHPGVTVNLSGASSPSLTKAVRDGTLDAAVVAEPRGHPSRSLGSRVLLHDRIMAVLPAGSREPGRPLSLEEVSRNAVITYGPDSGAHGFIRDAFAARGLELGVSHATSDVAVQLALVKERIGIALAPRSSPLLTADRRTVAVPLEPAISFRKMFVWRLDNQLAAPLRALLGLWTERAGRPSAGGPGPLFGPRA